MSLPPLPSHVLAEAQRKPVAIPPGTSSRDVQRLLIAMRKSELRKHRALRDAVGFSERVRKGYARKVKR